ncbi:hypothetical protein ID866_5843 [Astraeus odoratus]|nr:hypothetical protein ID866_5843 [Astraeus odoratus]
MVGYNVVFTGETGHGKSSLVNLLVQLEASKVSRGPMSVTERSQRYTILRDSHIYRLWDTPGFNGAATGNVTQYQAENELRSLFKQLASKDGIHLVVFCLRYNKWITEGNQKVYKSILSCARGIDVPIVAVVTHADEMAPNTDRAWWDEMRTEREKMKMYFAGHAYISTLKDESLPPSPGRRQRNLDLMWRLMQTHIKPLSLTCISSQTINLILFGESGVGKSSVVNLISGRDIAQISGAAEGCTLSSTEYAIELGPYHFRIWDTVGLNGPAVGFDVFFASIKATYSLICHITAVGGINLLLFCLRGGRIKTMDISNYRLFYELLCEKHVPIGLVITHLENERNMEDYWINNEESFTRYGIKSVGHACVTALSSTQEKYKLSKLALHGLLTDCDRFGKYTMPPEAWFIRFASAFLSFVHPGERMPKGKKMTKALRKRCGFSQEIAEQMARQLRCNWIQQYLFIMANFANSPISGYHRTPSI